MTENTNKGKNSSFEGLLKPMSCDEASIYIANLKAGKIPFPEETACFDKHLDGCFACQEKIKQI